MRHVLGNWVLRACFCLGLVFGPTAWAHKSSDSYLRLSVGETGVTGEWYLALHDLEFAIGIDVNEDGDITWGELKQRKGAVLEYARSRLGLESDAAVLEPKFEEELRVDQLANGGYVVLRCRASWPKEGSGRSLRVENRVFFDGDPLHRGMLVLDQGEGKPVHEGIFHPQETRLSFDLERPEPGRAFVGYLTEGVRHIGLGYDHVLFLLVLLLPSVLTRERDRWVPRDEFRGAFWSVVRIVTAFTIAHSVTLTAAALDWVRLPSRFVESTIAASIVVAALNNLAPRYHRRTWLVAFGFGLVHGFGFASVLSDLGLPRTNLVQALVGFNLGVEAGQLAIVGMALPAFYVVRRWDGYRWAVLGGGSVAAALLAAAWLWQRLGGS